MLTKTLSALMAVVLLSSVPAFSIENENLRGGQRRSNNHRHQERCVRGTFLISGADTVSPGSVNVNTTAGSGFTLTTPNPVPLTIRDVSSLYKSFGAINWCAFAANYCFTLHVKFTCPFKCEPSVIVSFSCLDCNSLDNSSTSNNAALVNQLVSVCNVTSCGFDINFASTFFGSGCGGFDPIPTFAATVLNGLNIEFDAVNCDCCPRRPTTPVVAEVEDKDEAAQ